MDASNTNTAELAASGQLTTPQTSDVVASPWIWFGVVVVIVALGVIAWFWWRKQKTKKPALPETATDPNPLDDWKTFVRGLPRGLRRVLDQFQAVFVFGDIASEKTEFVRQFSGHARRERQYGKRVCFQGEALSIYLGDRCVVIVPTDAFVSSESARTDSRWRGVITRACRAHVPRVVACLAASSVKSAPEVLAWASTMRAHVDTISSVRDEPIPLSVVIAQSTTGYDDVTARPLRTAAPIDSLFELLASLRVIGGGPDLSRMTLAGISGLLTGGEEQRRVAAKRWLQESMSSCLHGWPSLLAQPDADPMHILGLAAFFRQYETYTGILGGGLADLLYVEALELTSLVPESLYLLPWENRQFVGTVLDFQGVPVEPGVRWQPTAVLRHRVAAATVFAVLALGVTAYYVKEQSEWRRAARYARDYDPGEPKQGLETVAAYALSTERFGFYDRRLVQCAAVRRARSLLLKEMDRQKTPEALLSFASLYITGKSKRCALTTEDATQAEPHQELSDFIDAYLDDWISVTGLKAEEIRTLLTLACPARTVPHVHEIISRFGKLPPLPDSTRMIKTLQDLSRTCEWDSNDEAALEVLKSDFDLLHSVSGADSEVLDSIEWLRNERYKISNLGKEQRNTSSQGLDGLVKAFAPFRSRLEHLRKLRESKNELRHIRRHVEPYLYRAKLSPADRSLLVAFMEQHDALKSDGTASLGGQTVELGLVRAALQRRSAAALRDSLAQAMHSRQSPFFFEQDFGRYYGWTSRRPGEAGVDVRPTVLEPYTRERFDSAVHAPLIRWSTNANQWDCPGQPSQSSQRVRALLREHLVSYLEAYTDAWVDVYRSFSLRAHGERQLQETLDVLAQPASPLRLILQELERQTSFTVDKGFPFQAEVADVVAKLAGLRAAADKKAQDDYAAIIMALAGELGTESSKATYGVDFDAALQDFAAGLSPSGRVALKSIIDPKSDYRTRVNDWADGIKLPWGQRGPVSAPIEEVYRLGAADIQRQVDLWWGNTAANLSRDILDRFPFRSESRERAELDDVMSWLRPKIGRMDSELKPMLALLTKECEHAKNCSKTASARKDLIARLGLIQRTLFDEKGEAKELRIGVTSIWRALQLAESRLKLSGDAVVFKEQSNRRFMVEVPWNKAYVPWLDVEVCAPDTQGVCERQYGRIEEVDASPWGLWNLLAKAERSGSRFTWAVPTPQGNVDVTYDLCGDPSGCDVLFSKVFEWL